MKLGSVLVTEFQSIRNSNSFSIGDITCLVGKNEAGKTALLRALYRLNPIVTTNTKFDVIDDYPRAYVEDYRHSVETKQRSPAIVIEANFTLDKSEISQIESELGTGILKSSILTLSKGYENTLLVSLEINENVAINEVDPISRTV